MKKIDWHAGFVSAMKLEFIDNKDDLIFEEEHHIANRAQRIDLLIIKNQNDAVIRSPVGAIFDRFNICEYKSPDQSLTYGDFYKTIAYAAIYLDETEQSGQYNTNNYTVSFIGEHHPGKLFKRLSADGITISLLYPGIYTLANKLPFRTQVIIISEISTGQSTWLRALTKHGNRSNLDSIVSNTPVLDEHYKKHADNVMDVFTSANKSLVKKELEDPTMCNAVNELFADQINELKKVIADMSSQLTDKDAQLADKDAIIASLQAQLRAQGVQPRSNG